VGAVAAAVQIDEVISAQRRAHPHGRRVDDRHARTAHDRGGTVGLDRERLLETARQVPCPRHHCIEVDSRRAADRDRARRRLGIARREDRRQRVPLEAGDRAASVRQVEAHHMRCGRPRVLEHQLVEEMALLVGGGDRPDGRDHGDLEIGRLQRSGNAGAVCVTVGRIVTSSERCSRRNEHKQRA
jgi:hypothetical protein